MDIIENSYEEARGETWKQSQLKHQDEIEMEVPAMTILYSSSHNPISFIEYPWLPILECP